MTKKGMGLRTKRKSGKRRRRKRRKKKRKGKEKKKEMKKKKTKGRKRNAVKNWNRTLLWHKESLIGIGDRDHLGIGTSEIEMNVVMAIVKGRQVNFCRKGNLKSCMLFAKWFRSINSKFRIFLLLFLDQNQWVFNMG